MTAPRNPNELVEAFLAEGPSDLPDQVFDAVRGEIHRTRQRTVIGPWRTPNMSNLVRVAFAAAVVGAIALAWVNFGPQPGGVGTAPTPTSSPTQSSVPSSTAGSAAPSQANLHPGPLCAASACMAGDLSPGTYSYEAGSWTPVRVAFSVPAGWSADGSGLVTKQAGTPSEVMFTGWQITDIYADACHHDDSHLVPAGTTTAEQARVLAAQKGRVASATTDLTVAGFPAKHLELMVPSDLDVATCTNGVVRPWPDPGPNFNGGYCCVPAGSIDDVSIVDVGGNRLPIEQTRYPMVLVFIARHQPGSSAADQAELQSIVDSIVIEQPSASPSP